MMLPGDLVSIRVEEAPPITRSMLLDNYGDTISGQVMEVNGSDVVVSIKGQLWSVPHDAVQAQRRVE